ncbi:hypothetical protein BH23PLA1_BH23PLA1_07510 [soil metagenome]
MSPGACPALDSSVLVLNKLYMAVQIISASSKLLRPTRIARTFLLPGWVVRPGDPSPFRRTMIALNGRMK